jgi:thioredoxin 1
MVQPFRIVQAACLAFLLHHCDSVWYLENGSPLETPRLLQAQAFTPPHICSLHCNIEHRQRLFRMFPSGSTTIVATSASSESESYAVSSSERNSDITVKDIQSMRLAEITAELSARGVSYADCFDRESLAKRLTQAREKIQQDEKPSIRATTSDSPSSPHNEDEVLLDGSPHTQATKTIPIEVLDDLRSKKVRELREECSKRQIRWGSFIEKEELVQAIWRDMQAGLSFSASGIIRPGKVAVLTGEQLDQELATGDTPLLLDVFATWCGPCNFLAPQLEAAAAEFGSRVRVAKLDSDQYPAWAGRLKVSGLPTILVFKNGEKERVEGVVLKDDLVRLLEPHT